LGLAYDLGDRAIVYGFAEATADIAGRLRDDMAIGPGVSAGIVGGPSHDRWSTRASATVTNYVIGDTTTTLRASIEHRLTLTTRTALILEAGYEKSHGEDWLDATLRWSYFFGNRRPPR
jgi:hypothetical protein